jgi:hypothetical protein
MDAVTGVANGFVQQTKTIVAGSKDSQWRRWANLNEPLVAGVIRVLTSLATRRYLCQLCSAIVSTGCYITDA